MKAGFYVIYKKIMTHKKNNDIITMLNKKGEQYVIE